MKQQVVGITEIAGLAGVTSQAVSNWRAKENSDFPAPMASLASGPIFRKSEIVAWLKRNRTEETLNVETGFYDRLRSSRGDDDNLAKCITEVMDKLQTENESEKTSGDRPGMLLGRIQGGKTRAFVGVIALAFDRGVDIAFVLTKGTKTLSKQTRARLKNDFEEFIDDDEVEVLDIMNLPKLRRSELRRKLVIVAKKQTQNLKRLIAFVDEHPELKNRKVLLIDDEADLASVRYVKDRDTSELKQGTIAGQIDDLRRMVDDLYYLQVTATPYSLYLQPDDSEESDEHFVFEPKRPAFTVLLPKHDGYIGGDEYFGADDKLTEANKRLFIEVSSLEQDALRKPDLRKISEDRVLDTANTKGLRRAIVTFLVAVCARRLQQRNAGERQKKYAMVIHNDTQRSAHAWQDQVTDWIIDAIKNAAEKQPERLRPLFNEAYEDLERSVEADGARMPDRKETFAAFVKALQEDDVVRERVNSDNVVEDLLDENGELKLRTPFNIFVGGSILDRGITIPNLISFYYGRNPRTMQADTVLQHSRLYGNRDRRDLSVTRLYTSQAVYDRLYYINTVEKTLRAAFLKGAHERGVAFIQHDEESGVRSCAPSKIVRSTVLAVSATDMLLPTGFQPRGGAARKKLESVIRPEWRDIGDFVTITREQAREIIGALEPTIEFDEGVEFEWNAMRSLIDYYSDHDRGGDGTLLLWVETGRDLGKQASGDKSGKSVLGTKLRDRVLQTARKKSALVLLQQEGGSERGWRASNFWWPVFAAPAEGKPCIFATKVAKD